MNFTTNWYTTTAQPDPSRFDSRKAGAMWETDGRSYAAQAAYDKLQREGNPDGAPDQNDPRFVTEGPTRHTNREAWERESLSSARYLRSLGCACSDTPGW